MIRDGAKVAIVLGVGALAALGVAAGVAMAKTPAPSSAPGTGVPGSPGTGGTPNPGHTGTVYTSGSGSPNAPPTTPPTTWTPATTIAPGQRVRVSVAAPDVATLAQSIGSAAGYQGWLDILANPTVQGVLQAKADAVGALPAISAWGPNPNGDGTMYPSPLPGDWPTDDLHTASEFHAEFVYGGALPLLVASLPIPVSAWVPFVLGGALPAPGGLPFAPTVANPQPGGPQAVAMHVGDMFAPGPFPALPAGQAWSLATSWAAGPPDWLPVRLEGDGSFAAIKPGTVTLSYGATERGNGVGGPAITYIVTVT